MKKKLWYINVLAVEIFIEQNTWNIAYKNYKHFAIQYFWLKKWDLSVFTYCMSGENKKS
jgi:hypothetical protein